MSDDDETQSLGYIWSDDTPDEFEEDKENVDVALENVDVQHVCESPPPRKRRKVLPAKLNDHILDDTVNPNRKIFIAL